MAGDAVWQGHVDSSSLSPNRVSAMSDGWVATQNGEYPRIAMFPVSAPGSAAWQPDPTSRLLHGIVTSRKYGHLVRCGRFPPTVAMVRIWPEAPLSTRGSPLIRQL